MTDPAEVLHCVRTHLGYMDNEVDQINRLMNRIRFEPLQGWNASLAESVIAKLRQVADDLEGLAKEEVREAAE